MLYSLRELMRSFCMFYNSWFYVNNVWVFYSFWLLKIYFWSLHQFSGISSSNKIDSIFGLTRIRYCSINLVANNSQSFFSRHFDSIFSRTVNPVHLSKFSKVKDLSFFYCHLFYSIEYVQIIHHYILTKQNSTTKWFYMNEQKT